jgi:hypothetical protein
LRYAKPLEMILRSVATLLHNTAMRINRRIARPVLGQFFDTRSYDNIRKAFRADTATLSDLTVDADDARAAGILDRHGIVILRNAIDPALADAARHEADAMAARLASAIAVPDNHGVVDGIIWQVGGALFRRHVNIDAQERPVANLRTRERGVMNGGVIDIFAIDKAARENGWQALERCSALLQSGAIAGTIAAVSPARPARINMLRSDSVTVTRGLHVDNLARSYKAFLYLDDVRMQDGPYAYVPGTHRRMDLLRREARLNSLCGRTDTEALSFTGLELPLPVTKGTVIVSCQSGVHRGMPQETGASRTVLIASYWPGGRVKQP